jgi:hypothetical protein
MAEKRLYRSRVPQQGLKARVGFSTVEQNFAAKQRECAQSPANA